MDRNTDICNSRVAFATENDPKSVKNAIISTMSRDIKKFQNLDLLGLTSKLFSCDSDLTTSAVCPLVSYTVS